MSTDTDTATRQVIRAEERWVAALCRMISAECAYEDRQTKRNLQRIRNAAAAMRRAAKSLNRLMAAQA